MMQNERCFLYGHKMLEISLCSNVECVRSQSVAKKSKNSENDVSSDTPKMPVTQAESGESA